MVPSIDVLGLVSRYDVFLLDAYGVLVTTNGPLEGASDFLNRLEKSGKRYALLSNDASRLPSTIVARFASFGLPLRQEMTFTSGMLIAEYFERESLKGARCVVLGTDDSHSYVKQAGGVILPYDAADYDVVVVADDEGYPFLSGIEQVLTTLFRQLDRGHQVRLILPNPDLIFPKGDGAFGLASGSVALVLENGLRVRYSSAAPSFVRLGKPETLLFEHALRALGASRSETVMIGDQLLTDIRGANLCGIDSVLMSSGLAQLDAEPEPQNRPTWTMPSLVAK